MRNDPFTKAWHSTSSTELRPPLIVSAPLIGSVKVMSILLVAGAVALVMMTCLGWAVFID